MKNPCKILLIEDDPADGLCFTELFAEAPDFPHEIKHCRILSSAIAELKEHRYDIILSDMGLPDSKGYATFESVPAR